MNHFEHQYIDRATGNVVREHLLANSMVSALYSPALEKAPLVARLASSRYVSRVLGYLKYDNVLSSRATGMLKFLRDSGIPLSEFVGNLSEYDTARKIFERQIRYWNCRPMPQNLRAVVCPADARALLGSMEGSSGLYLKQKFFSFPELMGDGSPWQASFEAGDYAVFRLTPEKYHYTHSPVSGRVLDHYSVEGRYFPCNPNAAVQLITPVSKNRRVVTILETDCRNGSGPGTSSDDRGSGAHDRADRAALLRGSLRRSAVDREGNVLAGRGPQGSVPARQQHRGSAVPARPDTIRARPDQ
ncbi:MAG TPA: phosphatidylserine decarboxylase [Terriglobales bacterium]